MINFDCITKEDIKQHNSNQQQIADHPSKILIIEGSGLAKSNTLLNLINHKIYTDKVYLYAKVKIHMQQNTKFLIDKVQGAAL